MDLEALHFLFQIPATFRTIDELQLFLSRGVLSRRRPGTNTLKISCQNGARLNFSMNHQGHDACWQHFCCEAEISDLSMLSCCLDVRNFMFWYVVVMLSYMYCIYLCMNVCIIYGDVDPSAFPRSSTRSLYIYSEILLLILR